MSRLCEEFYCLPSQAYAEWERLQGTALSDLLIEILETRAYAAAKQATDAATTAEARKALPKTELFGLVKEITFELVQEARRKRADGESADD
jgi:hypothetical protein